MTDFPAWIGAIGTVGTLTTGLILFSSTISDRRREYSKLVAAWTELETIEGKVLEHTIIADSGDVSTISIEISDDDWPDLQGPFSLNLKLQNNCLQPVYSCRLRVALDFSQLPPGGNYTQVYEELNLGLGIVAPGMEITRTLIVAAVPIGTDFQDAVTRAFSFDLRFTDSAGRFWARDETGRLVQLHRSRKMRSLKTRYSDQRHVTDQNDATDDLYARFTEV